MTSGVAAAIVSLTVACSAPEPVSTELPTPRRVLMLVANDGFFFQEYYDPRRALEDSGLVVDVASAAGGTATPHAGSYDGRFTGLSPAIVPVTGTLRVADVSVASYDALVIVGGWGASRYYFAYPGTFAESAWQRDPTDAAAVNTLIAGFVAANKRILGVCNGVNVLAWARVPGPSGTVSPLAGRQVRAPWGSAPAQTAYLGSSYGSSWSIDQACPWDPVPGSNCFRMGRFATDNGALMPSTYGSLPDIADAADSARRDAVGEDGLILTAQDNFAARTAGRRLATRLLNP